MHSPTTTPEKQTKSAPIIKYRKGKAKTKPRRKKIIKINKYSLVYIVKCAFIIFSYQARIKICTRCDAFVIKRLRYLRPSTLSDLLVTQMYEQTGLPNSHPLSQQSFLY